MKKMLKMHIKIEKYFLYSKDEKMPTGWIVAKWISSVRVPANVRVKIDVNPVNFM